MTERHTETNSHDGAGHCGGHDGARLESPGHTWPYEPGEWTARGRYWIGGAEECPVRGRSVIRHGVNAWKIDSEMQLLGVASQRFRNVYQLYPPQGEARVLPCPRRRRPDGLPLP